MGVCVLFCGFLGCGWFCFFVCGWFWFVGFFSPKQIDEIVSSMKNIIFDINSCSLLRGKSFSLEQEMFSSPFNISARPLLRMTGVLC